MDNNTWHPGGIPPRMIAVQAINSVDSKQRIEVLSKAHPGVLDQVHEHMISALMRRVLTDPKIRGRYSEFAARLSREVESARILAAQREGIDLEPKYSTPPQSD